MRGYSVRTLSRSSRRARCRAAFSDAVRDERGAHRAFSAGIDAPEFIILRQGYDDIHKAPKNLRGIFRRTCKTKKGHTPVTFKAYINTLSVLCPLLCDAPGPCARCV